MRSYKETVDQIFYIPAAKDGGRCASYYADLEGIARIFVDFTSRVFDEYSNLPFAYEKARLDNFAIYLQKDQPTWKAYIVAYPGAADIADAGSRTTRAKQYLTSIGLSEKRIFTMIGEVRDTFTVQLYALPPDSPPPTPPSVPKNRNKIQD